MLARSLARFQQLTTPTKRGHKDSSFGALSDGSISVDSCLMNTTDTGSDELSFESNQFQHRRLKIPISYPAASPHRLEMIRRTCDDRRHVKCSERSVVPLLEARFGQHVDRTKMTETGICMMNVCKAGKRQPLPLSVSQSATHTHTHSAWAVVEVRSSKSRDSPKQRSK